MIFSARNHVNDKESETVYKTQQTSVVDCRIWDVLVWCGLHDDFVIYPDDDVSR